MKNELVSVIIPTYNRISYLQIAIDSVINQTYSNYELIIIDDGSTDNTEEVIQEKYGNRVIYIWQENQGESVARNRGISMATGKYIAFLDSDDYWDPMKLEIQVDCLSRKKIDAVAGVFSPVWAVDEFGKKIEENPKGTIKSQKDFRFENLLSKFVILGTGGILLRTECVREIGGFDHSIQYGEDQDFLLRLRLKWDFLYIGTPLVYIRRHPSNQSGTISEVAIKKIFSDRIKVIRKNAESNDKINKKIAQNVINKILISAASWCFYYERWDDGIQYLFQVKNIGRNVIYKVLPPKVAHIASIKFFQQKNFTVNNMDKFICNSFINKIAEKWDKSLGVIPVNEIKGHFFQKVILETTKIRKKSLQYLLVLFIKYRPQIVNQKSVLSLLNLE